MYRIAGEAYGYRHLAKEIDYRYNRQMPCLGRGIGRMWVIPLHWVRQSRQVCRRL